MERNLGFGKERTKFTHDGLDVLVDDDAGTLTKYLNGPGIDNKLRTQTGSGVSYFLSDHLGSTNGLTDTTGNVASQTAYDSFGNATNAGFASRYQFTGREFDPFSGMQFSRARSYDPRLGRFTSEDPIGFGGGDINLYGYVWNNPTGFVDPMGLDGWGNDLANWADQRIEVARQAYQGDAQSWEWNGTVNSVADFTRLAVDPLRVGSGVGNALYDPNLSPLERGLEVATDGGRALAIAGPLANALGRLRALFPRFAAPGRVLEACPIRTIKQQAEELVELNGGRNRVTVRSENFQMDVDLRGASHGGIETPHTKISPRNYKAPGNGRIYNTSNKSSTLRNSTQDDIRLVRRYLERRK